MAVLVSVIVPVRDDFASAERLLVRFPADFRTVYDWCAMQRLMQALGAYGFLGHTQGRPDFLTHIPAALASLDEVLGRIEGATALRTLVSTLKADC